MVRVSLAPAPVLKGPYQMGRKKENQPDFIQAINADL